VIDVPIVISVVSGSVYRLGPLQQMVTSVRANIPAGIGYEIIIVGVADDEPTAGWCKAQADIRYIAQPELAGAIKAFDEGAAAARGEYVILANDDIVFAKSAILRALLHMERTPTCGAVAFADDRPTPQKAADVLGFGVQLLRANPHNVIYACVGMYRKWIGDICGWWGSGDPIMRRGHTYGGDTYLSARIWELGYSVDWVAECRVKDLIYRDNLREINHAAEANAPGMYHKRFPDGPTLADTPLIAPPDSERLRVLYLPVYEPGSHYAIQKAGKRGLRDAFARLGLVWEIDYINEPFDLAAAVRLWQPDLLFLQMHSAEEINADLIRQVRAIKPDMAVVNWNGDVYAHYLLQPSMVAVLKEIDLQLCINASVLPRYAELGIRAAYWQIAAEPVDAIPDVPAHDVLLLANAYSAQRKAWGDAVARELGDEYDVAIYGSGWAGRERGQTTYNFAASYALTQRARITVGDNQWEGDGGFVSNRFFEALAVGGALMLHQRVASLQEFTGFTPGQHYIEWTDLPDLFEKARYYLAHEDEARAIAQAGREFSEAWHTFDARVDDLLNVILPEALYEPA
jgi:spore maturation protein CgeB/glycosyltransferase involved in cell wall biosynthesis